MCSMMRAHFQRLRGPEAVKMMRLFAAARSLDQLSKIQATEAVEVLGDCAATPRLLVAFD